MALLAVVNQYNMVITHAVWYALPLELLLSCSAVYMFVYELYFRTDAQFDYTKDYTLESMN